MLIPTFEKLAELTMINGQKLHFAGGSHIHPNPRLYKYYWWVFTKESPSEGEAFLTDNNRLCMSDFDQQIKHCISQNLSAYIYNQRYYRYDEHLPWDYEKLKQNKDIQFAPSFELDLDPLTPNGYK